MKVSKTVTVVSAVLLIVISFVTLAPLYLMFINSFKTDMQYYNSLVTLPLEPTLETYQFAWKYVSPFLINSLLVTFGVTALSLVCSLFAGFAFYKYDFPFKNALFSILLALMMVPGFMTLAPQFVIAKNLHLLNTIVIQILPLTGAVSVLSTFLIRTYLEGLPRSLFEAAEIEGANVLQLLWRIVTPLCTPILTVVLINNSIQAWNNYIWPLVAANAESVRPVIIAIKNSPTPLYITYGTQFACYVIASLPMLVLFAFNTKAFVAGLTNGAVKA